MKLKKFIKKIVYSSKPLTSLYRLLKYLTGPGYITFIEEVYFDGWNMVTGSRTPWMNGGGNSTSQDFYKTDKELKKLVADKKINLTQFIPENTLPELENLNWRHYIVYWTVNYAIQNTKSIHKNLVECGVCDGLTIFYAMNAAKNLQVDASAFLYDAWDAMRSDLLLEAEKKSTGSYSYLNIENTKANLSHVKNGTLIYNKGYIPEVFAKSNNPDNLIWLHLDLNSVTPTIDSLEFFWDKLEIGGIILFDDFAWPGYLETQNGIENWIKNKRGNFFQFPTGQAMFIKLNS
jgi:O-methyltransferase